VSELRAVGLVPHRDRPAARALAATATHWFLDHGIEVRMPKVEAEVVGLPNLGRDREEFVRDLDLVLVIGGDGTMLHTVQLVYPDPVPLLGVNAGQLGYLTAIESDELEAALPALVRREYSVSQRMMLEVVLTCDGGARTEFALNEAVLERQLSGHLVRFDLAINGTPFTSYAADGIIVATPTGSTAYSFSVHGPIASPALQCLMLTPISPHMLFDRTLVLAAQETLEFVVAGTRQSVCTIDGRNVAVLTPGDRVTCRAAREPLHLVELRARDFHQILKTKFALPDR
jgi:NAD+ kinase